jgi:hypothetical protein
MSFTGKFLGIAMLSLAFTASAGAQAPQVEKERFDENGAHDH